MKLRVRHIDAIITILSTINPDMMKALAIDADPDDVQEVYDMACTEYAEEMGFEHHLDLDEEDDATDIAVDPTTILPATIHEVCDAILRVNFGPHGIAPSYQPTPMVAYGSVPFGSFSR